MSTLAKTAFQQLSNQKLLTVFLLISTPSSHLDSILNIQSIIQAFIQQISIKNLLYRSPLLSQNACNVMEETEVNKNCTNNCVITTELGDTKQMLLYWAARLYQ